MPIAFCNGHYSTKGFSNTSELSVPIILIELTQAMSAAGMLSPFLFWMPRFPNSWWITTNKWM